MARRKGTYIRKEKWVRNLNQDEKARKLQLPLGTYLQNPMFCKRGKTLLNEVGKVYGRFRYVGIGERKKLMFRLWVGASAKNAKSLQVDTWYVSGEDDIAEALTVLRSGITVAVQGYRITSVVKDELTGLPCYEQLNVVEAIMPLSQKLDEAFQAVEEMKMYDRQLS